MQLPLGLCDLGVTRTVGIWTDHPGIVPSGDIVSIDRIGIVEQSPELDPVVALHARVRRATLLVLVDKVVDDLLELRLQIQSVKRNR